MILFLACINYLIPFICGRQIKDHYIVVLRNDNVSTRQDSQVQNSRILNKHLRSVRSLMSSTRSGNNTGIEDNFRHIYNTPSFIGYAGKFDSHIIQKVQDMDDVELIERDSISYATGLEPGNELSSKEDSKIITQSNSPWGLARISHRTKVDNGATPDYQFFNEGSGKDVTVYIIDTGVNIQHEEFGGRARWGTNVVPNGPKTDDNGHGTHVAGTIGSSSYGVAKKAELVAVKVLGGDGSGTNSDIIAGINWATNDAVTKGKSKGSVANMSLGGGYSQAVNMAVDKAVESGLAFAVASGNDNSDACQYSPASAAKAMSIGATNINDKRASFSNWGKCVKMFAPGEKILSTWIGSNTASRTISGTSMASPHIAGLMAYFMSISPNRLTPSETYAVLLGAATPNVITDIDADSPNLLAFNLASS